MNRPRITIVLFLMFLLFLLGLFSLNIKLFGHPLSNWQQLSVTLSYLWNLADSQDAEEAGRMYDMAKYGYSASHSNETIDLAITETRWRNQVTVYGIIDSNRQQSVCTMLTSIRRTLNAKEVDVQFYRRLDRITNGVYVVNKAVDLLYTTSL